MSALASVEALKYEYEVWGMSAGFPNYIEKSIFIGSYQLNIDENGRVRRMDSPYGISGVEYDKIIEYHGKKNIKQLLKKTDKKALALVHIPKDLADRIQTLYQKSIDGATPQGQVPLLKREIAQIFQQIWRS